MIENINAESVFRWIFRNKDDLSSVVFFFISKRNATNARFHSLFEQTQNIRIVYFSGTIFGKLDRISIFLFSKILLVLRGKIAKYDQIHLFNTDLNVKIKTQILHIDDPAYTDLELIKIKSWERTLTRNNLKAYLVCTNNYSYNWYKTHLVYTNVVVIEQGFHEMFLPITRGDFSLVYSSPYIHYGRDKHSQHTTWGASLLIDEIIPEIVLADPTIKIKLIGELGINAKQAVSKFENVLFYERVSFKENMKILSTCSVGLYPRRHDHKRSILKIYSYIGAGLPVVTFDLIDTEVIKLNSLGYSVNSVSQFVQKIIDLKRDKALLSVFQKNIEKFRTPYSWKNLANKMESIFQEK